MLLFYYFKIVILDWRYFALDSIQKFLSLLFDIYTKKVFAFLVPKCLLSLDILNIYNKITNNKTCSKIIFYLIYKSL